MKLIPTKNIYTLCCILLIICLTITLSFHPMETPLNEKPTSLTTLKWPTIMPLPANFHYKPNKDNSFYRNNDNKKYHQQICSMLFDQEINPSKISTQENKSHYTFTHNQTPISLNHLPTPLAMHKEKKATQKYFFPPLPTNMIYPPTIIANKISALNQNDNTDLLLIKTIKSNLPLFSPGTNCAKKNKQKYLAKEKVINILYEISFKKNIDAQLTLIERFIERCSMKPHSEEDHKRLISCALEYLAFLVDLSAKNIPLGFSETLNKKLITARNNNPSIQYILQACRYLHKTTPEEKKQCFNLLKDYDGKKYIKEACLFLINYGDPQLSDEDAIKKFIDIIRTQNKSLQFLRKILKEPLFDVILNKLSNTHLAPNDQDLISLNIIRAQTHLYNHNLVKAQEFFSKINPTDLISNPIHPSTHIDAFNTFIITRKTFSHGDIEYLSSIAQDNMYSWLLGKKKGDKISYPISVLINTLLNNPLLNIPLDTQKKLILCALEHLNHIQKREELFIDLAIKHAAILYNENDIKNALKYILFALQYNKNDQALLEIINQIEHKDAQFYTTYKTLITHFLLCIKNKNIHHNLWSHYTSKELDNASCSDFFSTLLASYKHALTKNNNTAMIYLIACYYYNHTIYSMAHYYIDKLDAIDTLENLPGFFPLLNLKANIYTTRKECLPPAELILFLKEVIYGKQSKKDNHNFFCPKNISMISSTALLAKNFFISSKEYYDFALNVILQLNSFDELPSDLIKFIHHINSYLFTHKDPFLITFNEKINESKIYDKLKRATHYDSSINDLIAELLFFKRAIEQPHEEKLILLGLQAHPNNQNLPIPNKKQLLGKLYYEWALMIETDTNTEHYMSLLDKAISYDNKNARTKKAESILFQQTTTALVEEAQRLLLQNIQENTPDKGLAAALLAYAHLHQLPNDSIRQVIPYDLPKAINLLETYNENLESKQLLAGIYAGLNPIKDESVKQQYINYKKALELINVLLNNNYQLPTTLIAYSYIYSRYNQPHKALSKINEYIHSKNSPLSEEKISIVLDNTLSTILEFTIRENNYTDAVTCIEKHRSFCKNKKLIIPLLKNTFFQNHVACIITNNITTKSAIKLCCLAALEEYSNYNSIDFPITYNRLTLKKYIFNAAQSGDINAQLTYLPYVMQCLNKELERTELYLSLYYANQALINTDYNKEKREKEPLLKLLKLLTQKGNYIASIIYLGNLKNNKKEIEETILSLHTASMKEYVFSSQYNYIKKILDSCRNNLNTYLQEYIQKNAKKTLVNTGSYMLMAYILLLAQTKEALDESINYFEILKNDLLKNTHLSQYKNIVPKMLGVAYQEKAAIEEKTTLIKNIPFLKKSAHLANLEACCTLARIYINECEFLQEKPLQFDTKDFLNTIKKESVCEYNNNCNNNHYNIEELFSLITKCETFSQAFKNPNLKNGFIKYAYNPNLVHSQINFSNKKNAQETLQLYELNDNLKLLDYETIINKHKNPLLFIKLANKFLMHDGIYKQNYEISRNYLHHALEWGLTGTNNNSPKKFDDTNFLKILIMYISHLVTTKHSNEIKKELLSFIKEKIIAAQIDINTFTNFLKKTTLTDLTTYEAWNNYMIEKK